MAEEEEADSITPGLLSDRCDTDFGDKSSMEQHIVSVHVSTKHNEKQTNKNEFIERDVSSGNSNDCTALHTKIDIKIEPASFSDTECETEKVCDETDIKTENLFVGEMPMSDTERNEKVNDGTDTKREIILFDGTQSIDTESKMTIAHGFPYSVDVTFLCKHCDAEFDVKSELAQHMLVHGSTSGPEIRLTTTGQRISDEQYQGSGSAVNTLQLPAACSNSRVQTNPTPAKTDFTESEPDTSCNTDLRSDTGGTIIKPPRNKGPKPYKCKLCDFRCAKRYYLNSHLRTHSGDKPYKCELCDYRGAQMSHINSHFRTHTQEKPYKCNLCNFQSVRSSGLTIHLRTHTGDKPYKCSLCDYKSAQSQHLKDHIKTHAREKPYKCNLCAFKSVRSTSLKKHIKKHHAKKEEM